MLIKHWYWKKTSLLAAYLCHLLIWGPACEHQQSVSPLMANGHLKVLDSSGLGPTWVIGSLSSAATLSYSRNCISLPQGKVTPPPAIPAWNVFPPGMTDLYCPTSQSPRIRGRNDTVVLVTAAQNLNKLPVPKELLESFHKRDHVNLEHNMWSLMGIVRRDWMLQNSLC